MPLKRVRVAVVRMGVSAVGRLFKPRLTLIGRAGRDPFERVDLFAVFLHHVIAAIGQQAVDDLPGGLDVGLEEAIAR